MPQRLMGMSKCVKKINAPLRDVDLIGVLQDCNLRAVNALNLSYGSLYTNVSYYDTSYSTIDYMCMPVEICDLVVHCEVADDICLNMSRHKPILCCLSIPIHCTEHDDAHVRCFVNRKKVSPLSIEQYNHMLLNDALLSAYLNDELTDECIDNLYHDVCIKLVGFANMVCPVIRKRWTFSKPYWCDELTTLHVAMETSWAAWCRAGRPRVHSTVEYTEYKEKKAVFRTAHRRHI